MHKIIALLLCLPSLAAAQSTLKLEWPRSFTGQPDFAFTRAEAAQEAQTRAARAGEAVQPLPSLLTLAADETIPDPLRLKTTEMAEGANALEEDISGSDIVAEGLNASLPYNGGLPLYASASTPDLTEFKATLAQNIAQTVATWQPNAARYDLASLINTLTLQAIVTSPQQYAIINGGRYAVGSSFQIRIPLAVPDSEIMQALDAEMPPANTFDTPTMAAYTQAYETALAAYAQSRNANPALGQQALNLPVLVKDIQTRKVVLEVNGQSYDLGMKYKY